METIEALWIKGGALSPWIFCATLLVLLFIADRIVHSVLNTLASKSSPNKHVFQNAVIRAFNAPFRGLIWVTTITLAIRGFFPLGSNETLDAVLTIDC